MAVACCWWLPPGALRARCCGTGAGLARRRRRGAALACAVSCAALCAVTASVMETGCFSGATLLRATPPNARCSRRPQLSPGSGHMRQVQVAMRESFFVRKRPILDSDLDDAQKDALDAVIDGHNVFLTGGAGTGKTFTLWRIKEKLKGKYGAEFHQKVAFTASTGTAAVLVGGCTLHLLAGIGAPFDVTDFASGLNKNLLRPVWEQELEVLIIDEISMISGEFLDLFEASLRQLRGNAKPFGGVQVVLVGDPFQLPPVNKPATYVPRDLDPDEIKNKRAVHCGGKAEIFLNRGMFFQSPAFWNGAFKKVELNIAHRMDTKCEYYKCLKVIRRGGPDKATLKNAVDIFNEMCFRPLEDAPQGRRDIKTKPVHLVPTVHEADWINNVELRKIEGTARTYVAQDDVVIDIKALNSLRSDEAEAAVIEEMRASDFFDEESSQCPIPKEVNLKLGARVMLVANMIDTHPKMVNGLCGTVTWIGRGNFVEVKFDGVGALAVDTHEFQTKLPGLGTLSRTQIPLRLAWAITHHKSQGKTIPQVVVNPESFTEGQSYVALSRSPSFDSLELTSPLKTSHVMVKEEARIFMETYSRPSNGEFPMWYDIPVPVEFEEHVKMCEEMAEALAWGF